jgi:PAS domain S-box-containing protein
LGIRPYRTLDHVIEGAVITFVEITARRLAEEKLWEAERFRHAAEIETMGIVFFKLDGHITFANDAFLKMCGFTPEDVRAGQIAPERMTPPNWLASSRKAMEELKAEGHAAPYEMEYAGKDGTRRWAVVAAHLIANGEAVEYIVDITQTKDAERKLRETDEKYQALLASLERR